MFQVQILCKIKHEKKRFVEINTPVSKNGYCNLATIQLVGRNYTFVPQIVLGRRDGWLYPYSWFPSHKLSMIIPIVTVLMSRKIVHHGFNGKILRASFMFLHSTIRVPRLLSFILLLRLTTHCDIENSNTEKNIKRVFRLIHSDTVSSLVINEKCYKLIIKYCNSKKINSKFN